MFCIPPTLLLLIIPLISNAASSSSGRSTCYCRPRLFSPSNGSPPHIRGLPSFHPPEQMGLRCNRFVKAPPERSWLGARVRGLIHVLSPFSLFRPVCVFFPVPQSSCRMSSDGGMCSTARWKISIQMRSWKRFCWYNDNVFSLS